MAKRCAYCGDELCLVHCVYCLTDCSVDEPEHGPACPNVTGMWPWDVDAVCCRCPTLLPAGSTVYRVVADGCDEDDGIFEIVCLSCKAEAELAV